MQHTASKRHTDADAPVLNNLAANRDIKTYNVPTRGLTSLVSVVNKLQSDKAKH